MTLRDHLARARPRRAGAADRGAGRQRLLPRPATGRRPAVRAHVREPVHRLHPARRGRLGHQHHRQRPAEPRACSSSTSASSTPAAATSSLRVDGVHNLGTHFIIGRTVGDGVQPGGRRPRPRRQPRVERRARSTTRCSSALEKRFGARHGLRASYTLAKALQLRERRPDPVRQRPHRPERPAARVRADAERSAAPLHVVGLVHAAGRRARVARCWTLASGVPMDILMPDAQSRVPALQRNAGGRQFKTAAELNALHPRAERGAAASTASRCRW